MDIDMKFAGDKKAGKSLLWKPEQKLKQFLLPKVPPWLETYHLTMLTLLWSLLIIVFSFLARHHIAWLWVVSFMIFLQYITDLLDGAIGRARDTGLVKWGFYMDHLLDYIFLCSILIGYAILLPDHYKYMLFFVLALFGAFMTNSFLSFAATNEFQISYMGIGPTEIRVIFIAINTLLIIFGKTHMVPVLPYVLVGSAFGLFITVFRTQRELWQIDLRAKAGAAGAVPGPDGPSAAPAALPSDRPDPMARIIANVGLSYLLAGVAFVFLMTKALYPHHRKLAAAIYVVSLVPFLLSVRARRATLRRHGQRLKRKVRPYWPHVGVAVCLVVFAYVAHVLAPGEDSLLLKLSVGELTADVERDLDTLNMLNRQLDPLLAWAESSGVMTSDFRDLDDGQKDEIGEFWRDYLGVSLDLDILQRRYKGFYLLDYNTTPDLHAQCFLAAYGAFVSQYRAALRVLGVIEDNPFIKPFLNEPVPEHNIAGESLSGLMQRVVHPEAILRLHAGAGYLPLVSRHLDTTCGPALERLRDDLVLVVQQAGRKPSAILTAPIDLMERTAFSAWFPLQKEVAVRMSHIRTAKRDYFITPETIQPYRARLRPGDILIQRRNWHMTNLGIPGFWPHVALYVGTPGELDRFFEGLALTAGRTATDFLRAQNPDAVSLLGAPDEGGYRRCIIEALREGVMLTSLEQSANCDYLAVIRPRADRTAILEALARALAHHGKPYDYNFDFATDAALVCSELVYKAFQSVPGMGLEPIVQNGRLLLPPNRVVRWFDESHDAPSRPADFVLFLDGDAATRSFVERDAATFRASWQRPKWDVLVE